MDFPTRHLKQPLPYDPSYEVLEEDEAETIAGLQEQMRDIAGTVHQDSGHAPRGVHAKSHGLLRGTRLCTGAATPSHHRQPAG